VPEIDHEEPPAIDPTSPLHTYRQIADWLERRIRSGDLEPNRPVPSEKTLGQAFPGVARTTIRRAVQYLRDEGLVYTVAQRGSYVNPPDKWSASGDES
jgi:GntR family transcriptional regulator